VGRVVKTFLKIFVTSLLLLQLGMGGANAHEIRPNIIDLEIRDNGKINIQIRLNLEAVIAEIGPEHKDTSESKNAGKYNQLRQLSSQQLSRVFDKQKQAFLKAIQLVSDGQSVVLSITGVDVSKVGNVKLSRSSVLRLSGVLPRGAQQVTWQMNKALGNSIVRVKGIDQSKSGTGSETKTVFAGLVKAGEPSKSIDIKNLVSLGKFEVFVQYIELGFEHIVPKGLDHILFVVGLFLLSTRLSSLLWQVSSFTLAHTITLGLAMTGFISAPSAIVEPLIAASIVYVAVENIFTAKLNKWRPVIVFLFGLLHGLGFASVLSELGLQQSNFVVGLIGFNIGVEVGQLVVIAGCFLLVGFWFGQKPYYRKYITIPASLIIAVIAAWWFVERIFI